MECRQIQEGTFSVGTAISMSSVQRPSPLPFSALHLPSHPHFRHQEQGFWSNEESPRDFRNAEPAPTGTGRAQYPTETLKLRP